MKASSFLRRVPWLSHLANLLRETVQEWIKDGSSRLAAALAYYTIFSLAPLLIIVIAVAGFFFGETHARDEILSQMRNLMGESGALYVRGLLETSWSPSSGLIATLAGFAMLLVGATGAFSQLQDSLNLIWDVESPRRNGVWKVLRQRLISFSLVLTMGFLMMVSLVLSAILSGVGKFFAGMLPAYFPLLNLVNWLFSLGVGAVLFALIYKILPDTRVRWRNVWLGAAAASLLFSIGRYFIGLYLGQGSFSSVYGAAGSFVVILLWVYYSAQILFFGAEFTWVCAQYDTNGFLNAGDRSRKSRKSRKVRKGGNA